MELTILTTRFKQWRVAPLAATAILVGLAQISDGFSPRILVTFHGIALKFSRTGQPYGSQRTVMVPFRETGALIGAKIDRSPDRKNVLIRFQSDVISYEPGHHGYRLNGRRQNMRASSEMKHGRLYVPIRILSDLTGGKVRAELR